MYVVVFLWNLTVEMEHTRQMVTKRYPIKYKKGFLSKITIEIKDPITATQIML